jgi:hypothetical protein
MRSSIRYVFLATALCATPVARVYAQAAASDAPAAAAAKSQLGTVKSVGGGTLVITTDAGAQSTISIAETVKVYVLAPGSKDLKTAQPGAQSDISVGDRVLVAGKPGADAGTFSATRVVLMKSTDIAQRNAAQQADWQRRGSGGIVSAVDAGTGTITVKVGTRTEELKTSPTTIYRRYAPGSIKFEEAQPGTLQQIATGDQLRVRGDKSEDGSSITAEEIVSGSFKNIAGTIVSLDAAASSLTVKDLASKKNVVIRVTPETELRSLPPEMAARFGARGNRPAGAGAAGTPAAPASTDAPARPRRDPSATALEGSDASGAPRQRGPGSPGGARGGADLAAIISRLPNTTLAELKPGAALMIVGSQNAASDPLTAITVLSGVEPILAATPSGSQPMTLSPWNLGGGGGEGGGGSPQ